MRKRSAHLGRASWPSTYLNVSITSSFVAWRYWNLLRSVHPGFHWLSGREGRGIIRGPDGAEFGSNETNEKGMQVHWPNSESKCPQDMPPPDAAAVNDDGMADFWGEYVKTAETREQALMIGASILLRPKHTLDGCCGRRLSRKN